MLVEKRVAAGPIGMLVKKLVVVGHPLGYQDSHLNLITE